MNANTLADAFHSELADILSAEKQLLKALPKMASKANSETLQKAFEQHLSETEQHVERVKAAFEETGKTPRAKKCEAMAGLLKEGEGILEMQGDPDTIDALLIAAAQKVEHYEIATYGTLCTWAELLDYRHAKSQLSQNMGDEVSADQKLTQLSKKINVAAHV